MATDVTNEVFNDALPDSISFDPQVTTIGDVSDIESYALLPIIDQLRVLCNISNQPEAILDLLAFQFQVMFYDGTFTIADPVARLAAKQDLIANNFYFHAHLGTPAIMQQVVSNIFQTVLVQEWFAYGGTANHYRILTQVVLDSPTQAQISSTQRAVKRASQAFDGFFLYNVAPEQIYIAVGAFTQIWQFTPVGRPGQITNFLSAGASLFINANVKTSSTICNIGVGATVGAVGRQVLAGATVATIVAKASMTNTQKILRRVAALIKAGHG